MKVSGRLAMGQWTND